MFRRLVVLSALGALLVSASAAARGRELPPGFAEKRGGTEVSLGLPQRWAALDQRAAAVPGVAQTLATTNHALAPYLAELAVPGSPLRLVAFDPAVQGGWATATVLATQLDRAGLAYDEWSPRVVRAVRELRGLESPVDTRRVSLTAGDAVRISFARTVRGHRLAVTMFVVHAGARLYTLTYSVPASLAGGYRGVFDTSARTLAVGATRAPAPPA